MSENRINYSIPDPRETNGRESQRKAYTAKVRKQQMNINFSVRKGPNGKFHLADEMANTSNLNKTVYKKIPLPKNKNEIDPVNNMPNLINKTAYNKLNRYEKSRFELNQRKWKNGYNNNVISIEDENNIGRFSPAPNNLPPVRTFGSIPLGPILSSSSSESPVHSHGKRGRNNTPKGMMRRQMTSYNLNTASPPTKKRTHKGRKARKTRGKRS